jgi:glycosyltransferase involved in cell wall biosynthesis
LYASGMSVLIPHSEDPAVTIVVDCPDGADFTAGVELDGAAAVEGIFRSLREDASLQAKEISSLSATLSESELQLDLYKKDLESHKLKLSSSESGRCQAEEALNVLVRSSSWRLTRPLRVGKRLLKAVSRYLARRIKSRIKAAVVSSESLLRSRFSAHIWRLFDLGTEYELRVAKVGPSARELTEMREQSFSKRGPVFSVIMPTYKTKPMWLKEAIESVRSQAYPFWELCIADDASDDPAIRSLLTTYAASDPRIKFVFLSENGHISRASNAALDLATGEFVVLLDHDDLLAPHALYRLSEAINKTPDVDVLYSDEDKVSLTGVRFEPTCKPAWSPEYFLSFMYTGHISAFRVALVREVGGFREGLEGSQDYDLMLRMTERSNRVLHVPDVLYHWRVHQDSVAANLDCKPYAFAAAKRAILDALVRRGFTSASVDDSRSRGLYVTRRNAATDLSAIIAVGDVSQGLKGEVVKVAEGDVVTICGEIDKLELADSAVVCVVEGASFKEEGSQTLLDYFCDPAIGIVAPRIVDSDGELMAAGAYYSQGEIKPHFKGAQSSDVGYRARLVVPFNVSFVYPQCFFLRAGLLRTLPQAITSTSELALAVALEARRRGLRCVIDPSVQAIQTTGCAIPEVSRDRVGMLMAHYGIQQFKDPFLPAGLPRYQGVQEMPNS